MKKLVLVSLVVFLSLPLAVYASSIGGAETLGQGKLGVGLDGEYVFERKLSVDTYSSYLVLVDQTSAEVARVSATSINSDDAKIDWMYRPVAKLSYGVLPYVDIFVNLGSAQGRIREEYSGNGVTRVPGLGVFSSSISDGLVKYKTDQGFLYGGGVKAAHEVFDGWFIGCNLQYLRHENDYSATDTHTLNIPDLAGLLNSSSHWKGTLTIQEWQAAPYIAKKIGNFTPYVGAKYSGVMIEDKPDSDFQEIWESADGYLQASASTQSYSKTYMSEHVVGAFVGLDYKIGEHWKLNLEGRFVDETAASFGASYKF